MKEKSTIHVFTHPRFGDIRTAGTAEDPLFCLVDVCKVLDIKNPRRAKTSLKSGGVHLLNVTIQQKNQYSTSKATHEVKFTFISEQNLYKIIMRSDKPQAEPFQDWVCGEVLPEIRKNGGYMVAKQEDTNEKILARALKIMEASINRLEDENGQLLLKAHYYDTVMQSVNCYTTTQVAKELNMSAIELNQLLCELNVQYGQSGQYLLYADYARKGFAKSRTRCYRDEFGDVHTHSYLVWTESGRKFLHEFVTYHLSMNEFDQ